MEKDNQKTLELRQIYCDLTQEERNEKSKMLVSRLEEKRSLEHEFSREVSSHKEAIKAAKEFYAEKIGEISGLINELLPAVSTGKEKREVYCMVKHNTPEAGFKMVQRQDTLEEWQEDMTSEEIDNLLLFAPSPAKEEEEGQGSDPDPEEDSEDSSESCGNYDEEELREEEIEEESEKICSVCGAINTLNGNKIFHIFGDKPVCRYCLEAKKEKGLKNLAGWSLKSLIFVRPSFGYGCTEEKSDTTCFRFETKGHSWGNPIYIPGNYKDGGTEAAMFYAELLKKPNIIEG